MTGSAERTQSQNYSLARPSRAIGIYAYEVFGLLSSIRHVIVIRHLSSTGSLHPIRSISGLRYIKFYLN